MKITCQLTKPLKLGKLGVKKCWKKVDKAFANNSTFTGLNCSKLNFWQLRTFTNFFLYDGNVSANFSLLRILFAPFSQYLKYVNIKKRFSKMPVSSNQQSRL